MLGFLLGREMCQQGAQHRPECPPEHSGHLVAGGLLLENLRKTSRQSSSPRRCRQGDTGVSRIEQAGLYLPRAGCELRVGLPGPAAVVQALRAFGLGVGRKPGSSRPAVFDLIGQGTAGLLRCDLWVTDHLGSALYRLRKPARLPPRIACASDSVTPSKRWSISWRECGQSVALWGKSVAHIICSTPTSWRWATP